jgi:ketosteroid isomerase-like protein
MDHAQVDQLADEYFRAASAHDYEALRTMFAPGGVAWSNVGGGERDIEALIAFMPAMRDTIGNHSYSDIRRLVTSDGFCEQHRVTSVRPDGSPLDLGDVCCVVHLDRNGKITRFDEYVDTHRLRKTLA